MADIVTFEILNRDAVEFEIGELMPYWDKETLKGDKGDAATIAVGTVTTGAAGSNASVTNSGTSYAAVFDFTIPKGDKGDKGDTGNTGTAATISVGTVSSGSTASVTNSGTTSAAVFDFVLPKGDKGDTGAAGQNGQDGQDGAAATISIGTVSTGAAGSSASVTNSGTSSAAVFDFAIPKGDKGDTGSAGADGQDGQDGQDGVTPLFWAEYGVTSFDDVKAAYDAGYLCMCSYTDTSTDPPTDYSLVLTNFDDVEGEAPVIAFGIVDTAFGRKIYVSVSKIDGETDWYEDIKSINGRNGTNGTNGADGVSPTLTSSKSGKTTTIYYTDKTHTSGTDVLATVVDGEDASGGGTYFGFAEIDGDKADVTIAGITELTAGLQIVVCFDYNWSPFESSNFQLQVNNLGYKDVSLNGLQALPANYWNIDECVHLVYTGAWWQVVNGNIANNAKYGLTKLSSSTSSTSTTVAATPSAVKAAYDLADGKAPTASPAFTGIPTAPTATAGTNTTQIATTAFVKTAVDNAIVGALQPAGSVTFANLPALTAANLNKIVNVSDAFTTTSDFVEGASKSYPAGTNVAIINTGTSASPVYKYDTYTGTFDFSSFATKVSSATNGNFASLDSNGNIADSGHKHSDYITSHQDITGKADKVTSATNGNFAALDSNGNLTDSGHKHSDYLTSHQSLSGLQTKITATGILKGDGNGGVSAATSGTDYQAPLTAGTDYQTPLTAGTDYQTPLVAGTDYQTPLVAGTDYQEPLTAGTDYQTPLVAGTDYQTPLTAGTDYIAPPSSPSSGNVLTYNGSAWTASAPATELPTQTGNSGKFLTTNGSAVSWANAPTEIPSQSGNSGKYLTTNGSAVSWANAPTEIPTQTGNSGKFLTTNGSAVSWGSVSGTLPAVSSTDNGKFLRVENGAWAAVTVPIYNGSTS